mgnify:FL=1
MATADSVSLSWSRDSSLADGVLYNISLVRTKLATCSQKDNDPDHRSKLLVSMMVLTYNTPLVFIYTVDG